MKLTATGEESQELDGSMTVEGVKHSPILSALFRTTADDSESELLGSAELIRGTRDHMKNTAKYTRYM